MGSRSVSTTRIPTIRARSSTGWSNARTTEFHRLHLAFDGLFGRRLQPIDCQNVFCEVSKYARIAHPDVPGESGRKRIKQRYRPKVHAPADLPFFPPKWGLDTSQTVAPRPLTKVPHQTRLF